MQKRFRKIKGEDKTKTELFDTMKSLHQNFLMTLAYQINIATFCRFRPIWVPWTNIKERETWKFVIHENLQWMIGQVPENRAFNLMFATGL